MRSTCGKSRWLWNSTIPCNGLLTIPITVCKWASFEKRNNLDKLISIPTNVEERFRYDPNFVTVLDGRTQDSNIKTRTIRNPLQISQLIHDPLCFQIRQPDHKNPQYERFLRPNPSIWRPIHPLIIGRLKSLRTSAFYWGQLKPKFRIQQHSILVYVSPSLHPPTQRFSCLSARQEILIMHGQQEFDCELSTSSV